MIYDVRKPRGWVVGIGGVVKGSLGGKVSGTSLVESQEEILMSIIRGNPCQASIMHERGDLMDAGKIQCGHSGVF